MVKVATPELPVPRKPRGATEFKEVARIWRAVDGKGPLFTASTRTFSQDVGDWREPLACLAKLAMKPFAKLVPIFNRALSEDTLAYGILRDAASEHFEEIDEAFAAAAADDHPGQLGVPDVAYARPDALEAISVWIAPDIDCPGCGETHKGGAFAGVTTAESLTAEDFGRALGAAARTCANMIVDTRGGDFDSIFMTIQTAMMEEPQEESYGLQTTPAHKH